MRNPKENMFWLSTVIFIFLPVTTVHTQCSPGLWTPLAINHSYTVYTLGHGAHYPPDTTCRWAITTVDGAVLSIKWEDFDIHYNADDYYLTDYVEVLDGNTRDNRALALCYGKQCDNVQSTDKYMYIHFVSDEVNSAKGFNATVTAINNENEVLPPIIRDVTQDRDTLIIHWWPTAAVYLYNIYFLAHRPYRRWRKLYNTTSTSIQIGITDDLRKKINLTQTDTNLTAIAVTAVGYRFGGIPTEGKRSESVRIVIDVQAAVRFKNFQLRCTRRNSTIVNGVFIMTALEGSSCLELHGEQKTWDNANATCSNPGPYPNAKGHLVVIEDAAGGIACHRLHDIIVKGWGLQFYYVWIGLESNDDPDDWKWVTGVSLENEVIFGFGFKYSTCWVDHDFDEIDKGRRNGSVFDRGLFVRTPAGNGVVNRAQTSTYVFICQYEHL